MPLTDLLGALGGQQGMSVPGFGGGMFPVGQGPAGGPLPDFTAGIKQAVFDNAMRPQAAAQAAPHGPSKLRNFLGAIADALSVSQGGQPFYHQQLEKRQARSAVSQYLGNVDPELAALLSSGLDSQTAVDLYKVRHPTSETPASLKEFQYYDGLQGPQRSAYENFLKLTHPGMMSPITIPENSSLETPGGGGGGEITATNPETGEKVRFNSQTGAWEPAGGQTAPPSGGFPVSKVLDALTAQESHGDGTAVGPQTKYGRARGSTQTLLPTAREMAKKLGLAFVPQMLHSNDPKALRYQRALGGAYLQEGLEKTGNLRDALHYYHGGPNRKLWGPKTRAYADAVLSRLGGS